MNRQIRLAGVGVVALFVLLFAQLNYLQVVRASSLNHDPRNTRLAVQKFGANRGDILSSDGVVLAHSVPAADDFKHLRTYPTGDLFAQTLGFFSLTYGEDGAERQFDADLTGKNAPLQVPGSLRELLVPQNRAQNVTLTLSNKLQEVAKQALGRRKGAVIALNPTDGAVLAMWSYPSFDANPLALHNQQQVRQAWEGYNADPNKPFLPRAYRERYFPGSTFKMVDTAAIFDHSPDLANKSYPFLSALPLPQTVGQSLRNFGGEVCGGTLPNLLRVSCNTGFAQIGLDLGADNLTAEADAFGFPQRPPLDLPAVASSFFPQASAFTHDLPGLAKSAIGQQNVSATPLEMALVAAGIANGGVIMRPHVLATVANSQGRVVRTYQPKPWLQATSADTSSKVRDLMIGVVTSGTGTAAQIPGVTVAGKTGTAQTGTGTVHTWFVCFAPAEAPRVAVAVIVENQPAVNESTGGAIAAPIARTVLQAALNP
jgi:peptidoglycan glycosyltransferase